MGAPVLRGPVVVSSCLALLVTRGDEEVQSLHDSVVVSPDSGVLASSGEEYQLLSERKSPVWVGHSSSTGFQGKCS